jgi:hypothetical protein
MHLLVAVSQTKPGVQSAEPLHVLAQLPSLPHRNGEHAVGVPSLESDESLSSLHVAPCTQVLPVHLYPDAQSVSFAHVLLHASAIGSHAKGMHDESSCALQPPAPSHCDAGVSLLPSHFAAAQLVAAVGKEHASRTVPSQVPAQVPVPAQAIRMPCGAPVAGEHVPTLPVTSHASH